MSRKKKNKIIESKGVYIQNEKGFDSSYSLEVKYNEITKQEEKEMKIKFYDLISFCSYEILDENEENVEINDNKFNFKTDMDLTYSNYKVARITYDEDGNKIVTEIPSEYEDKQIIFEDEEIGEYAFYGKKKRLIALPIMAVIITLIAIFGITYATIPGFRDMVNHTFTDILDLDAPEAPEIKAEKDDWVLSNLVSVTKDAKVGGTGKLKYYEYCVREDENYNKCMWKTTLTKNTKVANDGIHYVWFRGVSDSGKFGKVSNMVKVMIDTTAPIIKKVDFINVTKDSIEIEIDSEDELSGIKKIIYQIDNGEFIESIEFKHIFNNLLPDTEHIITIYVIDKVGNENKVDVMIKTTVEENQPSDNNNNQNEVYSEEEFDKELIMPTYSVSPSNGQWAMYKYVTITYPKNSKVREYSVDGGKTWLTYTGPVLFTQKGNIIARCSNNKYAVVADPFDVVFIDPVIPIISLNNVPSVFEYMENYKLPGYVKFGESGGSVTCTVDGVKQANTSTLKIGKHLIECTATSGAGAKSTVTKEIEVDYISGVDSIDGAWANLTLNYPDGSTNRSWMVYDPNTVVQYDSYYYQWSEYVGPIRIRVEDIEKVIIAYEMDGKEITSSYSGNPYVIIQPDSYRVEHGKSTNVKILYGPQDYELLQYRISENGAWINYTEPFDVGPNTIIEAKIVTKYDVYEGQKKITEKKLTSYHSVYIAEKSSINPPPPGDNFKKFYGIEFNCPEVLDADDVGECSITFGKSFESTSYKIYRPTSLTSNDYVSYVSNSVFDVEAGDVVYAKGQFIDENGKIQTMIDTFRIKDGTNNKIKIIVQNENPLENETTGVKINYAESLIDTKYRVDGGVWIDYTGSFEAKAGSFIEAIGTLPNTGKRTYASKQIGVSNYNIVISASEENPRYGTFSEITIKYNKYMNVKKYRINGSAWMDYTGPFNAAPDSIIEAWGKAGDLYDVYATKVLGHSDYIPPYILEGPHIHFSDVPGSVYKTEVSITTDQPARWIKYKINDGSYKTYEYPFEMSKGREVCAYYQSEEDGAISKERCSYIDYPYFPGAWGMRPYLGYTLSPGKDEKVGTKKVEKVKVTLHPGGATVLQYSYDGIVWTDYTGPFDVFTNCTIYVKGSNAYGRDSLVIHIDYIGDVAPSPQGKIDNIRIDVDPSGKIPDKDINGNTTYVNPPKTTVKITYDQNAIKKYYRVGTGDLWKEYTGPFDVTENCTIYAYQITQDGTNSASKIIDFLDSGYAEPIISYSPMSVLTTLVTVDIAYDQNAIRNTYSVDGETFVDYTEPFDITEKDVTIYAKSEFADGTIKYATAVVGSNIATPRGRIDSNSDAYYIIYLNYPETSYEPSRKYKYKKTGELTKYKPEGIMLIKEEKVDEVLDADGNAYIIDKNGNKVLYEGDHYLLDVDINNIWEYMFMTWENQTIAKPKIIVDEEKEWVDSVKAVIVYTDDAVKKYYSLTYEDGKKVSGIYKEPLVITSNCTIRAYAENKAGVLSKEAVYVVTNVDNGDPSVRYLRVTEKTMHSLTLEFLAEDTGTGIGKYEYSLDGITWEESDSPIHVFDNLDTNTTYTLYARAYDSAGNSTDDYSITATTNNIDKPMFNVTPNATEWSSQKTISIEYLSNEYINEYSVDNGTTWIEYTDPITIKEPTVIMARSRDSKNTSYADTLNITRVDNTKPTTSIISTSTLSSRLTVKANAIDNESGILRYFYSIDGTNYYSSFDSTYTFNNLNKNTQYTVYVYSENMASLTSDVVSDTEKTLEIDPPFFTRINSYNDKNQLMNSNTDFTSGDVIDNSWGYTKQITITYPYLDEDCVYEYALVDLSNPQNLTWKNANVDVSTGESKATIKVSAENMAVIARVTSGPNVVTANTLKLNKVDRTEPTIDLKDVPKSLQVGDSYVLPSHYAGDNNKSGATAKCTVKGNVISNTNELRSGMHPLVCTVTTGAGHSVTINHTLPVYPSLTFDVDSILQGVKYANITTDGDFYFSVDTGSEVVKYTTEVWLYNGNTVFDNPNTKFCDDVKDKMCVIKVDGDLTIGSGVNLKPQVSKKGFLVYVTGKLINNGNISMTGLGYSGPGENVYLYKNAANVYEVVPAIGGTGAEAAIATNSIKAVKGNNGIQTSKRATGGGGSGGAVINANYTATSGAGANGTSYSGGPGGGAAVGTCNVVATSGDYTTGKGGVGAKCGTMNYGIGGGVGNPTATSVTSANSNLNSTSGTGGLLIIYANDFENNNTISANGIDALNINGTNAANSLYAAGGGSGAGSVNIFFDNLTSKGTVTATGGKGGNAGNATLVANGGNGADGRITYNTIVNEQVLGSQTNPYQISTAQEFLNLKNIINDYDSAYIELANDIDLTGYNAEPIGTKDSPFASHFNGNGYTVNGISINQPSEDNVGIFGIVSNASISNVRFTNANIIGNDNVGILAGSVYDDSEITNVKVTGTINGNENVGGLIGYSVSTLNNQNIKDVASDVEIEATSENAGGLVGKLYTINNASTTIESGSSIANINSTSSNVGGLVGLVENKSTNAINIVKSSSLGDVKGTNNVGGLIGKSISTNDDKILLDRVVSGANSEGNNYVAGLVAYMSRTKVENAYATGSVTSNDYAGAFVGYVEYSNIENTYAIGEINSASLVHVGGYAGVSKDTTAQNSYFSSQTTKVIKTALGINSRIKYMLSQDTSYNSFDFDDTWSISEGSSTAYLQGLAIPSNIYNINYNDLAGAGSATNPYLIYNVTDLIEINNELGAHYKLMNDINLSGIDFDPIGQEDFVFTGTLDGNNHKIIGLNIDKNNLVIKDNIGLFEALDNATIFDLTIEGANVTGNNNVGILAGKVNKMASISNVKVTGQVEGNENVGGLFGNIELSTGEYDTTLNNITTDVSITATNNKVGGVIGYVNVQNTFKNSLVIQNVDATVDINNGNNVSNYVGGVVGYILNTSTSPIALNIVKTSGNVEGINYTGGVVGEYESQSTGQLDFRNIESSVEVNATGNYTGGAIGWLYNKSTGTLNIDNVKCDGDVTSTKDYVGGVIGASQNVSTGTVNIYAIASDNNVSGVNQVGGAIGYVFAQGKGETNISMGYSESTVSATGTEVGGFIGRSTSTASTIVNNINKCYSTGSVSGTTRVGGFVGFTTYSKIDDTFSTGSVTATNNVGSYLGEASVVKISNSYAIGKINTTGATVGGFAATASNTTATNCFFSSQTTGYIKTAVGTNIDTKNKKMYKLFRESTYVGYDFIDDWAIVEDKSTAYIQGLPIPQSVDSNNISYNKMDGEGTEENPYIIRKPEDVDDIRNEASAYYILGNDIDMTGYVMKPIGETIAPFSGTLDGKGFTISGYTYSANEDNVGLFSLATTATIKNLNIDGFDITGKNYVGGLIGNVSENITIDTVNVTNSTITGTGAYVGGLIGYINEKIAADNTFNKVNVNADVTGTERVGGLIGYSNQSVTGAHLTISECEVSGNIKGNKYVGGLAGYILNSLISEIKLLDNTSNATISENVSATESFGGLVGQIENKNAGKITIDKNTNNGNVNNINKNASTITTKTGGLVGYLLNSNMAEISINNNLNKGVINGKDYVGGMIGYLYTLSDKVNIKDYSNEETIDGRNNVGGMIGYLELNKAIAEINITNAENKANITATDSVGGIIGNILSRNSADITLDNFVNNTGIISGQTSVGGLVGIISNNSTGVVIAKNFVSSSDVNATGNYVGGLIGHMYAPNASAQSLIVGDSYATGNITGKNYVGGLIGSIGANKNRQASVTNSYATGNIEAVNYSGGLIGQALYTDISKSYATGNLKSVSYVGGLIGQVSYANVVNTFATGSYVNATNNDATPTMADSIGGLVGIGDNSTIQTSYASGIMYVNGNMLGSNPLTSYLDYNTTAKAGSLIGSSTSNVVQDSYYSTEMSGVFRGVNGISRTIEQMLQGENYNFDYDNVWTIDEGTSTPYLQGLVKPSSVNSNNYTPMRKLTGSGTEADPYLIYDLLDLNYVRFDKNAAYKLMADIDLTIDSNGSKFLQIGEEKEPFMGILDGNNHKIYNGSIYTFDESAGLFASLQDATIRDLTLENITYPDVTYVGQLAGIAYENVVVNNLNVINTNETTGIYVGGVYGYVSQMYDGQTTLNNININAQLKAHESAKENIGGEVGGLIGHIYDNGVNNITISDIDINSNTTISVNEAPFYNKNEVMTKNIGGLIGKIVSEADNNIAISDVEMNGTINCIISTANTTQSRTYNHNVGGVIGNSVIDSSMNLTIKDANINGIINTNDIETNKNLTSNVRIGGVIGLNEEKATTANNKANVILQNIQVNTSFDTDLNLNNGYLQSNVQKYYNVTISGEVGGLIGKSSFDTPASNSLDNKNNLTITSCTVNSELKGLISSTNDGYTTSISTGGLVGNITSHTIGQILIEKSYTIGNINNGSYTGGIVGRISQNAVGTIKLELIYSTGNIEGKDYVGGLIGSVEGTLFNTLEINKAYSVGNIKGESYVGGIAGLTEYVEINDIFTTGTTTGNDNTASFIGKTVNTTINHSYSVGKVTSKNSTIGGFVTQAEGSTTNNSYFSSDSTVLFRTALGTNIRIDKMIKRDPCYALWDFDDVWTIETGDTLAYLKQLPKPDSVNASNYTIKPYKGQGTEANAYEIYTAEELLNMRIEANAHYKLMNDIDFTDIEFVPIGEDNQPFTGSFDGQGYTISNITIDDTGFYNGFYGVVEDATIKNVNITNLNINSTKNETGGLIGLSRGNTYIEGVNITYSDITSTGLNTGGLIGSLNDNNINQTTIKNVTIESVNDGIITGSGNVGGLIGYLNNETSEEVYITNVDLKNVNLNASVNKSLNMGGLIGYAKNVSDFNNLVIRDKIKLTGNITTLNSELTEANTYINVGGIIGNLENSYGNTEIYNVTSGMVIDDSLTVSGTSKIKTLYSRVGGAVGYTNINGSGHIILDGIVSNNDLNSNPNCPGTITRNTYTGGLIGMSEVNNIGTIELKNSSNTRNINGISYVGGIVGYINNKSTGTTTISKTYNTGNVTGNNNYIGGVVGFFNSKKGVSDVIEKTYNTGNVTGNKYVGGFAGQIIYANINDCYSTGDVDANDYVSAFIGSSDLSNVTNVYTIGKITSKGKYIGSILSNTNGDTFTNAYFASEATEFTSSTAGINVRYQKLLHELTYNGFEFTEDWAIDEGNSTAYLQGLPSHAAKTIVYANLSGAGTIDNPYLIHDVTEFKAIAGELNAYYELANDIVVPDGMVLYPIGTETNPFTGSFNGNNHTIKNVVMDYSMEDTGLFGYVENATIKNVNVENATIKSSYDYVGILAGRVVGASNIENISVQGKVEATGDYVGGLIGAVSATESNKLNIENIKVDTNVVGENYVGGLIGSAANVLTGTIKINNVEVNSITKARNEYAGNLIGQLNSTGVGSTLINDVYITGTVKSPNYTGGLIGESIGNELNPIRINRAYTNCEIKENLLYAGGAFGIAKYNNLTDIGINGKIEGMNYLGGIAGKLSNSGATNVYANTLTIDFYTNYDPLIGESSSNDLNNLYYVKMLDYISSLYGTDLDETTSTKKSSYVGFNFNETWHITEGVTTPYLNDKYKSGVATPEKIEADSILQAIDMVTETSVYTLKVENNEYKAHVYVYNGDQEWNESKTFGSMGDVANLGNNYAQRMVVVKVNGDLTIGNDATISPYFDEQYGGPKGFTLYVTGKLTNNGTIDNSHGAYAPNENVLLWKNADGTYEELLEDNSNLRATGTGGNGGASDNGSRGIGAIGTSYSGGPGGGGGAFSRKGADGAAEGGAGGNGVSGTSYGDVNGSAGGAGNPGGKPSYQGRAYAGSNGTGGLLTIYSNELINNGLLSAHGSEGGKTATSGYGRAGGGGSGGGSINIFVKNIYGIDGITNVDDYYKKYLGNVNIKGGSGGYGKQSYGTAGSIGTINVGTIVDSQYYDLKEIYKIKTNEYLSERSIHGNSILDAIKSDQIDKTDYYSLKVGDKIYLAHIYVYDGNQEWNEDKTFGNKNDVAQKIESSENVEEQIVYASAMVVVKVNGDLTIGNDATISPYFDEQYGGPKGFTLYVTGKLTNNGTIDNSHGAYAPNENVLLWNNTDGTYEELLEDNSNLRATGTGGNGGASDGGSRGIGAIGTSYSGGSGGGGGAFSRKGADGATEGGAGGNGVSGTSYGDVNGSAGGAGNPGGKPSYQGRAYAGSNGTGGLLTIYSNELINNGLLSAHGSEGGKTATSGYGRAGGGGSGGGSINIFVDKINEVNTLLLEDAEGLAEEHLGNIDIKGGSGGYGKQSYGLAGSIGTVNMGRIINGQYYGLKEAYEKAIGNFTDSATIEGTSLISAIADNNINKTDYYNLKINDNEYLAHIYVYNGNQVWNNQIEPFGTEKDVANEKSTDTSTTEGHAKHMVIVKVNGDLTIGKNVTVGPYYTKYGGPKGFMLYVTGTLTNNGTIDNSHGAIAENEDVYLYKNANGTYEYLSKDIVAIGGEGVLRKCCNVLAPGNPGANGTNRSTGGGGSGASYGGEDTPRGTSGTGGSGTVYSGGSGGGGSDHNSNGTWTYAGDGSSIGGAGGDGYGFRASSSWVTRTAGGGAGNPGGKGGQNGKGNIDDSTVKNGTGGLLIIHANNLINNESITANGAKGGSIGRAAGGSSGGGSINIFVTNNIDNNGKIEAKGGESVNSAGAGGNGSISIGKIIDGQYHDIDYINTKKSIKVVETTNYPIYSLSNYQNGTRQIELQNTDSNINELYYSIDNGTTWTKYVNQFEVSENIELKVKGKRTDNTETSIVEYPLTKFVDNKAFDSNIETTYVILENESTRINLDSNLNSMILKINSVGEVASDATITFYNSSDEVLKTYNVSTGLTNVTVPENATYMVINAGLSDLNIAEINNQNDYISSAKQNKPNITVNTAGVATSKTVSIQYPTGNYTKEYSLDEGETWLEYTVPITITENTSILTRVVENGEVIYTASYNLSNISEEFYTMTGTMKKDDNGEETLVTEGNLVFFPNHKDVSIENDGKVSVANLKNGNNEVYYMGTQDTSTMTDEEVINNAMCSATFTLSDTTIEFTCNNGDTYRITNITMTKQESKVLLASDVIYNNEEYTECQDVECALNELHEKAKGKE